MIDLKRTGEQSADRDPRLLENEGNVIIELEMDEDSHWSVKRCSVSETSLEGYVHKEGCICDIANYICNVANVEEFVRCVGERALLKKVDTKDHNKVRLTGRMKFFAYSDGDFDEEFFVEDYKLL